MASSSDGRRSTAGPMPQVRLEIEMEIVELKSVVLPALFDQPTKIGEYGATESTDEQHRDYHR